MAPKRKVIFVQTESWFFLSHFKPLADALNENGSYEAAIISNVGKNRQQLEALGLKILPFDFERSSFSVVSALKISLRLIAIFRAQRPDIVHFVALKPILTGGIACLFFPRVKRVFHVTGLGYLADGKSKMAAVRRYVLFRLMAFFINHKNAWLVAENPDDLTFLARYGAKTDKRTSLFGGAGVDPDYYRPQNENPDKKTGKKTPIKAAYVGRMIWSKGVDVAVKAQNLLAEQNIAVDLELYGDPDLANPKALQTAEIKAWSDIDGVTWHGPTTDVREVWRVCEICVVPTITREGMPRAMLEAAACGRALIVTDVPGCRHFVRNGIEGLIVPPDDAIALADAIKKLVQNPELRRAMGKAARQRVLQGYTEKHVREQIMKIYNNLVS